jgi:hypothetical protein
MELFNPMNFDPWNRPLKIQKSIGSLTPKVRTHLWMCGFIPSHSPILLKAWNVIHGLHSCPTPLQALALVTSPKLRLRQSSFSSLKSDSDTLVSNSKGNQFHYRMFITCARPNFGSFPTISFDFEGAKKSQMHMYKL